VIVNGSDLPRNEREAISTSPSYPDLISCIVSPMAEWRDLGYVPDSDDDDGFESIELPRSGPKASAALAEDDSQRAVVERDPSSSPDPLNEFTGRRNRTSNVVPANDSPIDLRQRDHDSLPSASQIFAGTVPSIVKDKENDEEDKRNNEAEDPIELPPPNRPIEQLFSSSQPTIEDHEVDNPEDRVSSPQTSSPLSSIRSLSTLSSPTRSPRKPTPSPPKGTLVEVAVNTVAKPRQNETENAVHGGRLSIDVLEQLEGVRRSKRHRDPIQLHPYLLEEQRYQQTVKSRGLQPVRVLWSQARASPPRRSLTPIKDIDYESDSDSGADESQIQDVPLASDAKPNSRPTSNRGREESTNAFDMPSDNHGDVVFQDPEDPSTNFNLSYDDDEELPDVHSIFKSQSTKLGNHVAKKRKLNHVYGKKNTLVSGSTTAGRQRPTDVQAPVFQSLVSSALRQSTITSPPPSSPSISSRTRSPLATGFRFPRGISPHPLPTPATSSEPRRPQDAEIVPSSSSLAESENELEGFGDEQERSPSPGTEVSKYEEIRRLHRLQRKIKGVLPASWLKLDLQAQKKSSKLSPSKNAGRRREQAKGVARKISSTEKRKSTQRAFTILISDGSDDSDQDAASTRSIETIERDHIPEKLSNITFEESIDLDDIREDNRIDFMLPSSSRPTKRRKTEKRQTKLNISNTAPLNRPVHSSHQTSRPKSKRQPRITERLPMQHRPESSKPAPMLSILDAADLRRSPQRVPRFLKVAARRVRRKQNKGRHSPTRKFIRLSTRADTEDATQILERWRSGTLVPGQDDQTSNAGSSHSRPPLEDRQANSQKRTFQSKGLQLQMSNRMNVALNGTAWSPVEAQFRLQRTTNDSVSEGRRRTGAMKKLLNSSRQGHLISSLRTANVPRAAQWEAVSIASQKRTSPAQFAKSLKSLSRTNLAFLSPETRGMNLPMSRFLEGQEDGPHASLYPSSRKEEAPNTLLRNDGETTRQGTGLVHRPKKRQPNRMDTETFEVRQPVQPTIELDDFDNFSSVSPISIHALTGYDAPGATYPIDFDIIPLQDGTFFHQSSFIGSDEFARSLNVSIRDFDRSSGNSFFRIHDQSFRWGPWNEAVSSEVGIIFQGVSRSLEQVEEANVQEKPLEQAQAQWAEDGTSLRHLVSYFTNHLSFSDRVDRESFANRFVQLVRDLLITVGSTSHCQPLEKGVQLLLYALVLINQTRQILGQLGPAELRSCPLRCEIDTLMKRLLEQLLSYLSSETALKETKSFYEANRRHQIREAGIQDENVYISAMVVTFCVTKSSERVQEEFWAPFTSQLTHLRNIDIESCTDVQDLEKLWSSIFTILPLLEMGRTGIFNSRTRFMNECHNWPFVQKLVRAVTDVYIANPLGQPASFNVYFRAILSRCFHLIKHWGWNKCERILEAFFDFFAAIGLSNLRNEETYGSPRFLDDLRNDIILTVEPFDRSFHLLLKIMAEGLREMSQIYSKSKIRSIVWRLIPNHGRSYPKEKSIRQEDLDALRNQHDLHCTLYWASPHGFRPKLATIKNLVHPTSSHREACAININSWARLLRYQLSTNEPASELLPFADWFDEFVVQMLDQHTTARTEAESVSVGLGISATFLESTVAQNQRQIEALLSDALLSLSKAITGVKTLDNIQVLLTNRAIPGVFNLFDSRNSRVNTVIVQALEVLLSYVRIWEGSENPKANDMNSDPSEDSQEFGDWTGFDEIYQDSTSNTGIQRLQTTVYDSLARLVSNCFGSDISPDDVLLVKVAECWTCVAQALVKEGVKEWSNYLGSYDLESWASLRSTDQTRKFTPRFFARILEKDSSSYLDNKTTFLSTWLSSVVERESMLKFQHRLTSAILNVDGRDPLLLNLPFSIDSRSGRYDIRLEEFSQRRLSLISCLLSNMRSSLFEVGCQSRAQAQGLRQEYRELLQHLMSAMKSNYQELGPENSAEGTYVDFVHRVVEFLQQHTVEICPVDRFFTDSAAFPLPATDPTYVVGRLRNYGLRLSEPGVPKQLVTFIQNVSERAAADDEHEYLVQQLHAAMSGTYEAGIDQQPTLRSFLLQNVFPPYIAIALENLAARSIVEPILRSIQLTLEDVLFDIDPNDPLCLDSVATTLAALLEVCCHSVDHVVPTDVHYKTHGPVYLHMLKSILLTISSALPVVDYILKSSHDNKGLANYVKYFEKFCRVLSPDSFRDGQFNPVDPPLVAAPTISTKWQDVRVFAGKELRNMLKRNWNCDDHGNVYVRRDGNMRKQLPCRTGEFGEEADLLVAVIERVGGVIKTTCMGIEDVGPRRIALRARRVGVEGVFF
jgi:hypothetical protein